MKPIPGFKRYTIAATGDIVDTATKKKVSHRKESATGRIIATLMNDRWEWLKPSVARLLLATYRPLKQQWMYAYAVVQHLDNDVSNIDLSNLVWKFKQYTFNHVVGVDWNVLKHKTIPGYARYEVNMLGSVRSRHTAKVMATYVSDTGYIKTRIIDDNGVSRNVGIHRLIALTFLTHPVDTADLQVNHKDGNKQNNSLENLEWVTHADNIRHAFKTGLNTRSSAIIARNAVLGTDTVFHSYKKCAEHLGIVVSTLKAWLSDYGRDLRYHGEWCVKFKSDTRAWPDYTGHVQVHRRDGTPLAVKDLMTGEITRYRYAIEFSSKIGVATSTVVRHVMRHKDTPFGQYIVRFDDNTNHIKWPAFTQEQLSIIPLLCNSPNKTVLCLTDVATGKRQYFSSIRDAVESGLITLGRVHLSLKTQTPRGGYLVTKETLESVAALS